MTLKEQLEHIVGPQHVFDQQETLQPYSKDQSFVPHSTPNFAVFPQSTDDVQKIVKLANRTKTPVIPFSSGLNFNGATVPVTGESSSISP